MVHPHDAIRNYIELKKRLFAFGHMSDLKRLEKIQWLQMFWDACKARMVQGAFRYGTQQDQREKYLRGPFERTIRRYLRQYIVTGNIENLFDMANRCMIEFGYARYDKQNFESQDDAEHEEIRRK